MSLADLEECYVTVYAGKMTSDEADSFKKKFNELVPASVYPVQVQKGEKKWEEKCTTGRWFVAKVYDLDAIVAEGRCLLRCEVRIQVGPRVEKPAGTVERETGVRHARVVMLARTLALKVIEYGCNKYAASVLYVEIPVDSAHEPDEWA